MATWKKVLTEQDKATDAASGVANGETGLVTGNAVFDYITAQNFGTGSGDITSVLVAADDTNTVGSASGTVAFTIAGGTGIDTSASGGTLTISAEDSTPSNKGVIALVEGEGINVTYLSGTATIAGEDASTTNKGVAVFEATDFTTTNGKVAIKALGVSNDQLAGSIDNSKLSNSTISGVSLGSNLGGLRAPSGSGLSMGSIYNGSSSVDISLNVSGITTVASTVDLDSMVIYDASASAERQLSMAALKSYMQGNLTFTTNTDTDVSVSNLETRLGQINSNVTIGNGTGVGVTIAGDLTVNGTTTTVNSTELLVDDKIITAASGGTTAAGVGTSGLEIDTGDATQLPFVGFVDGAGLTEMVVKAEGNTTAFPIAIMEFSSNSTAPSGDAGGVGSFHFDTGNDTLYIRTA
jgi:hypothetical protein